MKKTLAYKKILSVCIAVAAIAVSAEVASAATIDFEDLTLGAEYIVGDTFTSAGVQITGEEFFYFPGGSGSTTSGLATVGNAVSAGGAGLEMWTNNINLRFDFGAPLDGMALQYGYFGGNINLDINGAFVNVNNLADIAPAVGGTSVFTFPTGTETGLLCIFGNINSFAIGGQEFAIDNVAASVVPEPATITMLGFGILLALKRKKPLH